MSNPISGVMCMIRGLKLLNQSGIRPYVIVPLLINFSVFAALIWLGASYFSDLVDWLMASLPEWLQWIGWLLWPLFIISALLIGFFTFSLVANVIAAPFNGLLSAAVERHLSGSAPEEQSSGSFLASILPTMLNELKKLLYFFLWAIPFLILFVIPVVNVVAPLIWFLFTAWMLALEYVDYPMDNRDIRFPEVRSRLRQKRLAALGFGSMVNLAMMVPVFNFLVMPASVAGATVYWLEQMKD